MSALNALTLPQLQEHLQQALAARHSLLTGASSVSFSNGQGSRSVSYQQRKAELDAYIAELHAAIAAHQGGGARRGPIYIRRG